MDSCVNFALVEHDEGNTYNGAGYFNKGKPVKREKKMRKEEVAVIEEQEKLEQKDQKMLKQLKEKIPEIQESFHVLILSNKRGNKATTPRVGGYLSGWQLALKIRQMDGTKEKYRPTTGFPTPPGKEKAREENIVLSRT
ncbi:hypothetical protein RUM44_007661 [Polyplax serrata]|uniref:Uncharacterized protein n=1 Tax=Polyplax serrata TaxID=468196 RepID=A0ABR1BA86_POLSC